MNPYFSPEVISSYDITRQDFCVSCTMWHTRFLPSLPESSGFYLGVKVSALYSYLNFMVVFCTGEGSSSRALVYYKQTNPSNYPWKIFWKSGKVFYIYSASLATPLLCLPCYFHCPLYFIVLYFLPNLSH